MVCGIRTHLSPCHSVSVQPLRSMLLPLLAPKTSKEKLSEAVKAAWMHSHDYWLLCCIPYRTTCTERCVLKSWLAFGWGFQASHSIGGSPPFMCKSVRRTYRAEVLVRTPISESRCKKAPATSRNMAPTWHFSRLACMSHAPFSQARLCSRTGMITSLAAFC